MKMIGFWNQHGDGGDYCLPQEIVGEMPTELRTRVAKYLDVGAPFEGWMGVSWCRFRCGIPRVEMGSRELTDGVWFWPEGLSHYVQMHGIILPEEFIAHFLEHEGISLPQELLQRNLVGPELEHFKVDEQFWRDWCKAHRSPVIAEKYRAQYPNLWPEMQKAQKAKAIAEATAKCGLSENRCLMAKCQEKALNGAKFCALHSYAMGGPDR